MRIARVLGVVTLQPRLPELPAGRLAIVETLDAEALTGADDQTHRAEPMPQSLVCFDELGAAEGQLIAVSEGREATMPFIPRRVPVDAYNAAILDAVDFQPMETSDPNRETN